MVSVLLPFESVGALFLHIAHVRELVHIAVNAQDLSFAKDISVEI